MHIGYARVSTDDQNLAPQEGSWKVSGCERIFYDRVSGAKSERPGQKEALGFLRDGEDVLVVWRLDRLGRSLKDLIELVNQLEEWKVGFKSLQDLVDITSSCNMPACHIFGALAEFERNLIRERTKASLAAARARGKKGRRRRALNEEEVQRLYQLYDATNTDGQ